MTEQNDKSKNELVKLNSEIQELTAQLTVLKNESQKQ